MLTFFNKYVKDELENYDDRHTPRFEKFQTLEKKRENVAQASIRLSKKSFNILELDEKDEEKEEKDEEEKDEKEEEQKKYECE